MQTDRAAGTDDPQHESCNATSHATDLTAFKRDILALLADEADYGLGIKQDLESYYGEEINHGRLYPNLDELIEAGLVEKSELDKRTNEYAITTEGVAIVRGHAQWVQGMLTEYPTGSTGESQRSDAESPDEGEFEFLDESRDQEGDESDGAIPNPGAGGDQGGA